MIVKKTIRSRVRMRFPVKQERRADTDARRAFCAGMYEAVYPAAYREYPA
jgi:hypothetical protein